MDQTKSTTRQLAELIYNLLNHICRKNNMLAKALKEKGNKSYGAGDNIEAMTLYNQALCYSR